MTDVPFRTLATSIVRIVVVIGVLLTAYFLAPLHHDSTVVMTVVWAALISLVVLAAAFAYQTRRINRSTYPLLAGVESLVIVLAIFLIGFAFVYLVMSDNADNTFSEPLNRTGAMYFAITVLSTVGFGDITPKTDPSRWLVSAQMLIDLGIIAGALRLLTGVAKRAHRRQYGKKGKQKKAVSTTAQSGS